MKELQLKRGEASAIAAYTGPLGEITVDTKDWNLHLQDGVNPGGTVAGNNENGTSVAVSQSETSKKMEQPFLWKRFTDAKIESYVAGPAEPFIDARSPEIKLRIGDGVTPGGHPVGSSPGVLEGVAIPQIIAPLIGATGVALSPIITLSQFNGILSDGSADIHTATTLTFWSDVNKTNQIYTTGRLTSGNLTTIDLSDLHAFDTGSKVYFEATYEGITGNTATSPLGQFEIDIFLPDDLIATLSASDAADHDRFGSAVAIAGDGQTAVIGAYYKDKSSSSFVGAAYIFSKKSGIWEQVAKLPIFGFASNHIGRSVAISHDGSTVVVSQENELLNSPGKGKAHVYSNLSGTWQEVAQLTASDGYNGQEFGYTVAISGDAQTIAVYARTGSDGLVYTYNLSGNTWVETAIISRVEKRFGYAISLSYNGTTLIAGAFGANDLGSQSGKAFIYDFDGTDWQLTASLIASDGTADDKFGISVDISDDGTTAVIGAVYGATTSYGRIGRAYVFVENGSSWTEQSRLMSSNGVHGDGFGSSVAISGDGASIIIGAEQANRSPDDNYRFNGGAYLFKENGPGVWTEVLSLKEPRVEAGDKYGAAVDISQNGELAVIGVSYGKAGSLSVAGSALIYA